MPENNIGQRFEDNITKVQEIKAFIDEMHENPQIATLSNKPVLSMLSTACEYLTVNLSQIRQGYLHETGE